MTENTSTSASGQAGGPTFDKDMRVQAVDGHAINATQPEPDMSDVNTRTIFLNDHDRHIPFKFPDNGIKTSKYSLLTFLPKNLFQQFKRFANVFYLCVSIMSTQTILWDNWVGNVLPLMFVLGVSAVKEAIEDLARHRSDDAQNNSPIEAVRDGHWTNVAWKDIRVGDMIKIVNKKMIPADVVVVSSSDSGGRCYIETANLDGETNSKLREVMTMTAHCQTAEAAAALRGSFQCGQPIINGVAQIELYKFDGTLTINGTRLAVGVPNLLLRGSQLRNTDWVIGFVVYTGSDTKLMLNSAKAPMKMSNVERVMNKMLYMIFGFLMCLCITAGAGSGIWGAAANEGEGTWYIHSLIENPGNSAVITALTSVIAFSFIIPISLYVSMEIVKLSQTFFMDNDLRMYHEETDTAMSARTSNLNEELGQVKYVFSDKTGTLTCNRMEFVRCSVAGEIYGASMAERGEMDPTSPSDGGVAFGDQRITQRCITAHPDSPIIVEFLRMLALCHSIIPEPDDNDPNITIYNASSPDESALVKAARELGFTFESRGATTMTIDAMGTKETYTVLNTLEFNSTRKRMSVVLKTEAGRYLLYCKGADAVILPRLSTNDRFKDVTSEHLDTFAMEGLRTLCLAAKELTEMEWAEWNGRYVEAATAVQGREEKLDAVAEEIEVGLTLLGATAIEDKLQDGVPETIQQLYRASVKVWMLTGDKQETAINIGYSCKLLLPNMRIVVINQPDEASVLASLTTELQNIEANPHLRDNGMGVVIDGFALFHALAPSCAKAFLQLADQCEGVICCRVSPKQKALVVKLVKDNVPDVITLSIGDGANDVSMIQEAHVGVGISGLEGMQAVLASDYAIAQFRFLQPLLLIHGRFSYRRIARLILYSFHKNLLFTLPQFYFIFYQAFSGQPLYESQSASLFNVLFSALPIIIMAIFENDVPAEAVIANPELYVPGQIGQSFNVKRHVAWSLSAIMQSMLIFFPAIVVMGDDIHHQDGLTDGMYVMGASAYCVVVLTVNGKIAQVVSTWTSIFAVIFVLVLLIWFPFMFLAPYMTFVFPDLWGIIQRLFATSRYWLYIIWAPVTCLVVDHTFKYLKRNYRPEPFHIVQENVRMARGAINRLALVPGQNDGTSGAGAAQPQPSNLAAA